MIDHGVTFGFPLTFLGLNGFFPFYLVLSIGLLVIMKVYVAMRMLSSSVEFLSACLYNSSIITCGSKYSKWKKGVDGPKLLLKF